MSNRTNTAAAVHNGRRPMFTNGKTIQFALWPDVLKSLKDLAASRNVSLAEQCRNAVRWGSASKAPDFVSQLPDDRVGYMPKGSRRQLIRFQIDQADLDKVDVLAEAVDLKRREWLARVFYFYVQPQAAKPLRGQNLELFAVVDAQGNVRQASTDASTLTVERGCKVVPARAYIRGKQR